MYRRAARERYPWEMTLAEFTAPKPKPRGGYVSLYHGTVAKYHDPIRDLEDVGWSQAPSRRFPTVATMSDVASLGL